VSDRVSEALEGSEHLLKQLSPAEQRLYLVRMATDPPRTGAECASILKVTRGTIASRWSQIKSKLGLDPLEKWKETGEITGDSKPTHEVLRSVQPDTFIKLIEMRLEKVLRGITDDKILEAGLKELTGAVRELVGARALVKGEPTQILRVDQRANLQRLMPALMKEMERRGLTVEFGAEGVRVQKHIDAPQTVDVDS
jgi:hypothetical protein